jgi:hypothetical protein
MHPSRADLARFFTNVRVAETGCWEWTGARLTFGYGRMVVRREDGRRLFTTAHRVACGWFVGPVGAEQHVDHLCRNASCVNPAHLEAVSAAENRRRSQPFRARRIWCRRGHPLFGRNALFEGAIRRCRVCRNLRRKAALRNHQEAA